MGLISRVRWGLAGALALLALGTAIRAVATYSAHGLGTAVLATIALAVTLLVGLASLGWARWRIRGELAGLQSSGGELLEARRKRLQAIAKTGVRPDRATLAEATAADEAGRAYIGRYLVATTVLLGLVGTFAGLMETLGRISPVLADKDAGTLALLAGPLAGLHVTFGASLVAIIATLALALAQGDLTLHENLALALLEDRTTHELIPALWPPAEDAAERTVRAVEALKTSLADSLVKALAASGKTIAESTRAESERAARALEATAATIEKQLGHVMASIEKELGGAAARLDQRLGGTAAAVEAQALVVASALEKQAAAATSAADRQMAATAAQVERQLASASELVEKHVVTTMRGLESQIARLGEKVAAAIAEGARLQTAALAEAAASTNEALRTSNAEQAARTTAIVQESAVRTGALVEANSARTIALAEETVRRATAATEAAVERATAITEASVDRTTAAAEAAVEQATGAVARTITETSAAATRAIEETSGAAARTFEQAAGATARAIEETSAAAARAVEAAATAATSASTAAASTLEATSTTAATAVRESTAAIAGLLEPLFIGEAVRLDGVRAAIGDVAARLEAMTERLAALDEALATRSQMHGATIERAGQSVLEAFDRAVLGGGAALDRAAGTLAGVAAELGQVTAGTLAGAATELSAAAATWRPTVASLAAELGALGREVALLATREPEAELGDVVLGELERLGLGVDRLVELVRLGATGNGRIAEPDEGASASTTASAETAPPSPADEPAPAEASTAVAVEIAGIVLDEDGAAIDSGGAAAIIETAAEPFAES